MKIIIDGKDGSWEVFIDISEQGVYKKVELSEYLRVKITTAPKLLTPWVQFVAREYNYVESQPNDQG